jgi:hypothetical protein
MSYSFYYYYFNRNNSVWVSRRSHYHSLLDSFYDFHSYSNGHYEGLPPSFPSIRGVFLSSRVTSLPEALNKSDPLIKRIIRVFTTITTFTITFPIVFSSRTNRYIFLIGLVEVILYFPHIVLTLLLVVPTLRYTTSSHPPRGNAHRMK